MFFSRRKNDATRACIRRLLVVEDDPLIAFDHEQVLAHGGYEVVATVNSAAAAITILSEQSIDAVILDLQLAGDVTGEDVARNAYNMGVAVLVVSGGDPGDAASHAFGWLRKPIAKGALVAAMKAMETVLCKGTEPRRVAGLTLFRT